MFKTYQKTIKRGLAGVLAAAMMLSTTSAFAAVQPTTSTKPLATQDYVLEIGKDKFDILSNSFADLAILTDTEAEAVQAGDLRAVVLADDDFAAVTSKRVPTLLVETPVEGFVALSDNVKTFRGITIGSSKLDMLAAYPKPNTELSKYLKTLIGDTAVPINGADYSSATTYQSASTDKTVQATLNAKRNQLINVLQDELKKTDTYVYFFTPEDFNLKNTDFYAQYKTKGRFTTKDYNIVMVTQKNKVTYMGFISNAFLNEAVNTLKQDASIVRRTVDDQRDAKNVSYTQVDLLIGLVGDQDLVKALGIAAGKIDLDALKEKAQVATATTDAETATDAE